MARGTMILGALLCSLCLVVRGVYSAGDDVIELTPSNFNREVIQSDGLWLVEFFAPWCGHCQSLAPQWKKAATALKGIVNLGAVDADKHKSLGGQYEIRGFPTIKIFGANKNKPENYQGGRTAEAIVDAALNALRSLALDRLNGGGGGGGGQDYGRQQENEGEQPKRRCGGKKKGGRRNKNKGSRKRPESNE